jgi:hypothetical protein
MDKASAARAAELGLRLLVGDGSARVAQQRQLKSWEQQEQRQLRQLKPHQQMGRSSPQIGGRAAQARSSNRSRAAKAAAAAAAAAEAAAEAAVGARAARAAARGDEASRKTSSTASSKASNKPSSKASSKARATEPLRTAGRSNLVSLSDPAIKLRCRRELVALLERWGLEDAAGRVHSWKVLVRRAVEGAARQVHVSYESRNGTLYQSQPEVARALGLSGPKRGAGGAKPQRKRRRSKDETSETSCDGSSSASETGEAAVGGQPPSQPNARMRSTALVQWQREKVEALAATSPALSEHAREYLTEGYTVFRDVLSAEAVSEILLGSKPHEQQQQQQQQQQQGEVSEPPPQPGRGEASDGAGAEDASSGMVMRRRKGNQRWMGAVASIAAHITSRGSTETVLCPLTTRDHGRYDMPLPAKHAAPILGALDAAGIMHFCKQLCRSGKLRTQDIMLSKPGSAEQKVHTDSCWDGKADANPRTHYITVLIPLTRQDAQTGGTRVWPRTHRFREQAEQWEHFVDMSEPTLCTGDALVFDGLLTHLGQANVSLDRDRYFYYAAFAAGHDANTDVTGS